MKQKRSKPLRIGIFGGSFDPPHIGHIRIAQSASTQLGLDRMLFVPAYIPPHKHRGTSASPHQRLAMVRLALKGKRRFVVSKEEIRRKGVSYTAVTLRALRKRFRRAQFYLLVGSDNARQFHTWKSSDEIVRNAVLAVYERGRGRKIGKTRQPSTVRLTGSSINISSSKIRQMLRQNRSVRKLVPPAVLRYITSKRLYHQQ